MAEDLTPRILKKYDSAQLQMGDGAKATTIVQFALGKFGPFEARFDREPDEYQIREAIEKRRRALEPFV